MKIAIINFSGNVGKTTIARQLLAPRMPGAAEFSIETINAGASDQGSNAERLKGKNFGNLQQDLARVDSAIVDIGASNVEEFVSLMGQFVGSHEDFDRYLVPVVSEKKQQQDTINTIETLAKLGVASSSIQVVFNRVELGDADDIPELFSVICGYHRQQPIFTLRPGSVIFYSEVYDRLRPLGKTVAELVGDATDYRAQVGSAPSARARDQAIALMTAQRLARSAQQNLDAVYASLFG